MAKTYHKRFKKIDGYYVRQHPNYMVWSSMKSRCNDKKQKNFINYGARNITYCDSWEHFENFCKDMGKRPSMHHSLERLDVNGNYEPSNCIWADRYQQAQNRRTFKNNISGVRGINLDKKSGRFIARCQYEGGRYKLSGSFEKIEFAEKKLLEFYKLMSEGEIQKALLMTNRKARCDSKTGIKGISKRKSGYIVRVTQKGKRIYLGHYVDFKEALGVLKEWEKGKN